MAEQSRPLDSASGQRYGADATDEVTVQRLSLPNDDRACLFQDRIDAIAEGVFAHPVMANDFYKAWRSHRLTLADFHVFAGNYFARVHATSRRISIALSVIDDWVSRIELLHNLTDELGHGERDNIHVLVLYRWLDSLSRAMGCQENLRDIFDRTPLLESTTRFIKVTEALCRQSPQAAAGALLAQEWHGYSQIAYLCDGFANYKCLYDFEDFHDISEYFYIHLGRAEKEHKLQASLIAGRNCASEQELETIQHAFTTYLDQLEQFWIGVARQAPDGLECLTPRALRRA